jgi:hypothetical protein
MIVVAMSEGATACDITYGMVCPSAKFWYQRGVKGPKQGCYGRGLGKPVAGLQWPIMQLYQTDGTRNQRTCRDPRGRGSTPAAPAPPPLPAAGCAPGRLVRQLRLSCACTTTSPSCWLRSRAPRPPAAPKLRLPHHLSQLLVALPGGAQEALDPAQQRFSNTAPEAACGHARPTCPQKAQDNTGTWTSKSPHG